MREAGKVLGFDQDMIGKVAALAPMWGWKDPDHTAAVQFKEAGLDIDNPRIRSFLDLTMSLQDLPRHLGQHSGGMVVCQGALDSVVPLEPASMPNRVVVQWDKEDCADMGIVKIDLLGLGMMAVLKDCLGLIRDHWREEIDLGKLPENDPVVYADAAEGRHDRHVPGGKPRANGDAPATQAREFLRSRGRGGASSGPVPSWAKWCILTSHGAPARKRSFRSIRCSSPCLRARWACRSFRSNCCAWR